MKKLQTERRRRSVPIKIRQTALLLLSACLLFLPPALLLSGCAESSGADKESGDGKLSVIATIFPEYDWVLQILGSRADRFDVTLLLDSGVDLHNYQPTAGDMVRIAGCDLFICVGGTSDGWVDGALESAGSDASVLRLLDVLGDAAKEEEYKEGMEREDEGSAPEYDEHVWLSLQNAALFCDGIADALSAIDPDGADVYAEHAAAYKDELLALDRQYREAVDGAETAVLLFADRFPFRYLTDDYGLEYYAAFSGCSAESEASFETVAFLAGRLDELRLTSILTLEGSDQKLARAVASASHVPSPRILTMDSMQSVTAADVSEGASYLDIMKKNLETLKEALP